MVFQVLFYSRKSSFLINGNVVGKEQGEIINNFKNIFNNAILIASSATIAESIVKNIYLIEVKTLSIDQMITVNLTEKEKQQEAVYWLSFFVLIKFSRNQPF